MSDKQHDLRKKCNASLLPHDGAIAINICIGRLYRVSGPEAMHVQKGKGCCNGLLNFKVVTHFAKMCLNLPQEVKECYVEM